MGGAAERRLRRGGACLGVVERGVDVHHQGRDGIHAGSTGPPGTGFDRCDDVHVPLDLVDEVDRPALAGAARGAQASGTPWLSFYSPEEIASLATDAGFLDVTCIPTNELAEQVIGDQSDGWRASSGEGILIART